MSESVEFIRDADQKNTGISAIIDTDVFGAPEFSGQYAVSETCLSHIRQACDDLDDAEDRLREIRRMAHEINTGEMPLGDRQRLDDIISLATTEDADDDGSAYERTQAILKDRGRQPELRPAVAAVMEKFDALIEGLKP